VPIFRILPILAALSPLSAAQQTAPYTIAGHVVRHLDQQSLPGVRVSIAPVKDTERQVSVTTGPNGEFSFAGVPAGKYQLQATHHGFPRLYQQCENYSTAIVTGPNQDTEHIVFTFDAPAGIAGTVVDEDNEPVPRVTVYLFSTSIVAGKSETRQINAVATEESGTFHFGGLVSGTYYVAVAGRPWYAQSVFMPASSQLGNDSSKQTSQLDVTYPLTYYSSATNPEGATPLKLQEGEKANIQIRVHSVPSLHIHLENLNASESIPPPFVTGVTQAGPGGIPVRLDSLQAGTELFGIAPGRYTFLVQAPAQDQTVGAMHEQAVTLNADTTLHFSDAASASLKGRILSNSAEESAKHTITLTAPSAMNLYRADVRPDGSFEIPRILPGHYSISLTSTPDTYFAKVEAKGATYTNGELKLAQAAPVELTIRLGRGVTNIDGIVVQDKKALAGAAVLLIPQDRTRTVGQDQSDSDGTFTIPNVPPGRYTLVAVDDWHSLLYADPAVIAPYLEHGLVLDVPLNKMPTVEVQHRK